MAEPTTFRPQKRQLQKSLPSKGPAPLKTGSIKDGPEKTVNWPDAGQKGNSASRLRGVKRVKTSMWERT